MNAIKIINNSRNIELLDLLEPYIGHKDSSIREEALKAKIVIFFMIHSLLDTDLYKFTMQQAVLHQFSDAEVVYEFNCRDTIDFQSLEN